MHTTRTAERGFTLIELLVVIAIIGLLSSVIIASLNSARSKGNDANVKSNFQTVRTQAELVYDNNNQSYSTMCTDPTIAAALTSAASSGGATGGVVSTLTTAGTATTLVCHTNGTAYAVQGPLKGAGGYWCIDSTGKAAAEGAVLGASAVTCT